MNNGPSRFHHSLKSNLGRQHPLPKLPLLNCDVVRYKSEVLSTTISSSIDNRIKSRFGEMKASVLSLRPIYQFVKKHDGFYANGRASSEARTHFYKLCRELTAELPDRPGFYLWGRYNQAAFWTSIYLGKAGFGKTACLRSRIEEELRDEKCCFWRIHVSEIYLLEGGRLISNASYLSRKRALLRQEQLTSCGPRRHF